MKIENYLLLVKDTLPLFEKSALASGSISINHGLSGMLLYYTQCYCDKNDITLLVTIRKYISLVIKNLDNEIYQTSFFLGPLGAIWTLLIVEKAIGKDFVDKEKMNLRIKLYLEIQKEKIKNNRGVVDYIYGIGGWFIIYPYLTDELQQAIRAIYVSQLQGFDLCSIGKVEYIDQKIDFKFSKNVLGFSHGLLSISTIIKGFNLTELETVYNNILKICFANMDCEMSLSRFSNSSDFSRQDWCHGNLGLIMIVDQSIREKIISKYLHAETHSNEHGVCHGLGQKILLSKIFSNISEKFDCDDIPDMNFNIDFENLAFIQTPLIAEMAHRLNIERDSSFSWWRMFYPSLL